MPDRSNSRLMALKAAAFEAQLAGDLDRAIGLYDQILALDPDDVMTWNNLTAIYAGRQDWQAAAGVLDRAAQAVEKARARRMRVGEKGGRAFVPAIASPRKEDDVNDLLGEFTFHANRAHVLIVTGRLVAAYPECAAAFEAEGLVNAALTAERDGAKVYGELTSGGSVSYLWSLIDQRRYEEAVALVESRLRNADELRARLASATQGQKAQHMLSKGLVAALQSKDAALLSRATAMAETIDRLLPEPTFSEVSYSLACVYAVTGDADRALDHIETALALGQPAADIKGDDDFAALRGLERFQQLVNPRRGRSSPHRRR